VEAGGDVANSEQPPVQQPVAAQPAPVQQPVTVQPQAGEGQAE
jgi:hypothetical protein